jgi:hypothetical protein
VIGVFVSFLLGLIYGMLGLLEIFADGAMWEESDL